MTDQLRPATPLTRLEPDQLRWECDVGKLDFRSTADLDPVQGIIGQDRALRAIQLGLDMRSPGYNIFLAGFVGTGRNTTVRRVLQRLDRGKTQPDDLCYVYNFETPDSPRAITVSAGKGKRLVARMAKTIDHLAREIPGFFDSDAYRERRKRLQERFQMRQRKMIEEFDERVQKEGFVLVEVQVGSMTNPEIVPTIDGEPKFFPDLEEAVEAGDFDAKKLEELQAKHEEFSDELQQIIRGAIKIDEEMRTRIDRSDTESVRPIVTASFGELREGFSDDETIVEYLEQAEAHVLEHVSRFVGKVTMEGDSPIETPAPGEHLEYKVNLIVDNSNATGAPVVLEYAPSSTALFGIVERSWHKNGEEPVDHMDIRAGALHRANGGYLVLNATDLFTEPGFVWNTLKRTLRTASLEIPTSSGVSVLGPPAMKPEPVPLTIKVVLIGDSHLYSTLYAYDEDFKKIFKVRADFDTEMENTPENVRLYGSFIQRLVGEEDIRPFNPTGLAEIAEYGSRLAGRRDKLSTRFNMIADLVRESSHFAQLAKNDLVDETHVRKAISEKDFRNSLAQEKMHEMIADGTVVIDVEGQKVGEVNGLAVYESGEHGFGIPAKITATVSMGNAGIINIEREAELSGSTHDKGVQILSGFLRSKYAQDKPLTLSASIAFEQSYHGVDGDSASSTEIYAILSALSGIPLRQDLAVTGSMNQMGLIQAIGGVNEKIEGFFDICEADGLTGTQGVLIPKTNLVDLMLHSRVVEAVRAGRFHIYPVETIDQGIETLTGIEAGEKVGARTYAQDTVNGRVDARLRKLANQMREYGSP